MFWRQFPNCATVKQDVFNVCVSSIAHHKYKISVTFSCILKVQVFNIRTQTAKDSHRKKFQNTYSRGKFLHEAQFLRMLTVS